MSDLTSYERVQLARHPKRPKTMDYIEGIFTDFFELRGDRLSGDDESIVCGIALYKGQPVTVIGQRKGRTVDENIRFNFGMPQPEGYRKVQRIAKQSEKFKRPIISFIDTPGAYPGLEAEEHGQGEAIAGCLAIFSGLKIPVISIVIGEGGSGGALAQERGASGSEGNRGRLHRRPEGKRREGNGLVPLPRLRVPAGRGAGGAVACGQHA